MKILRFLTVCFCVFSISESCNKIAPAGQGGNAVYINEASVDPVQAISYTGGVDSVTYRLTPRLVYMANENISVDIDASADLVATYNQAHGTQYLALPQNNYKISANTTKIYCKDSGNISGASVAITFNATDTLPREHLYLLPVTIKSASDNMSIMGSSKTVYYVVDNSVIISVAASMTNNYFTPNFSGDSAVLLNGLNAFTYEALVKVNQFQQNNPYISSVMGVEGYLLMRFGDASLQPGELEITTSVGNVVMPSQVDPNSWHHLAAVYDGSAMKIYVDEVQVASQNINLGTINLRGRAFYIGYSYDGRELDGAISECRIWSTARTVQELSDNKYIVNDPKMPGLLAYWKFNEGAGNVAKDATGHGFDATASSSVLWVPAKLP